MLLIFLVKTAGFVMGADTRYNSAPQADNNSRDNLYVPLLEEIVPYEFMSRVVEPHHRGYGPSAYSDLELAGRYAAGDRRFLRDEDMLQRRFTSHGLSNHWLAD